jgi:hypothetical protein
MCLMFLDVDPLVFGYYCLSMCSLLTVDPSRHGIESSNSLAIFWWGSHMKPLVLKYRTLILRTTQLF